jgi:hypothetical protein
VWRKLRDLWPCALLICACIAGCAGPQAYISKDFTSTRRLAVLPAANEATDLDGPPYIRQLIFNRLKSFGYQVIPLEEVDAKLLAQGFTEGGQLGAATPQKLGEWIGADTLFYITIENFDYITVGYYSQRRVKVLGKITDAVTGERLWEAEREGSTRFFATNKKEAERQFAAQMAIKMVEKTTHKPLQPESLKAIIQLVDSIPRR